jgi:ATP-dependent DNA helicase RecG
MSFASSSDPSPKLEPASAIGTLPGIGAKRGAALTARGISTILDAVLLFPSGYHDWRSIQQVTDLHPGLDAIVEGVLGRVSVRKMPGARFRRLATATLSDSKGASIRLVWFNLPAHMSESLPAGQRILAAGRVSVDWEGAMQIANPEFLISSDGVPLPVVSPVYRLPKAIGQKTWSAIIARALWHLSGTLAGTIPNRIRPLETPSLIESLRAIHQPAPDSDIEALRAERSQAHRAVAMDELFAFQVAISLERARAVRRSGISFNARAALTAQLFASLPFALTAAQQRAIDEIRRDMASPGQMNRILIGDVGTGKTLVAFFAALRAIESGYQTVVMAPTELLAEQHLRTFNSLCGPLGIRTAILASGVTATARREILAALANGSIQLVFGTHALVRSGLRLPRLGLAVIDEQHRFGVFDRALLKHLAPAADMLLMTATPIPRSLALTLFAHLAVSRLDERPAGRAPVQTVLAPAADLDRACTAIRDEVARGNRAFIVVPRIDGFEGGDSSVGPESIESLARKLPNGLLEGLRVGSLHGRVASTARDVIMRQFRDGSLDVLIATTLIEVGIDVSDATVIAIIAAERYGLAQLHQLRGRVGRGSQPSRCFLVPSANADAKSRARLALLASTEDGDEVAAADLALRGPGDLFGTRQSGALPLRFAALINEVKMIEQARVLADRWLEQDPNLGSAESRPVRRAIDAMYALGFSMGDVG